MTAIEKVIEIAKKEVGYLEKRSNSDLDSETVNAGSANCTKYWRDIKPLYQGQPWCACFVTWCLVKAFGNDIATQMLGHYPYVYCPTGKSVAQSQRRWTSTPSVGAVIIFSNSSGTAVHTGIVYDYDRSKVYTIEGNTSGGSTVIANGGGVCKKSYSRSYGRILGYWNLDYNLASEEDDQMEKEFKELKAEIAELKARIKALEHEKEKIYHYGIELPDEFKPAVVKLMNKGYFNGAAANDLNLSESMLRTMVINDRAHLYD